MNMKRVTEDEFYKILSGWNTILMCEHKKYPTPKSDEYIYSENDVILAVHKVMDGHHIYEVA